MSSQFIKNVLTVAFGIVAAGYIQSAMNKATA